MTETQGYILELSQDVRFMRLLDDLKKRRPVVPEFDPINSNVELWKMKCGELRGYQLVAQLFNLGD